MADHIKYPIPKQSVAAYRSLKPHQPRNPGLIFERFTPTASKPSWKQQGLQAACVPADKNVLAAYKQRWLRIARWAHASPFTLKTDWRFIPGLGRKGPLEVGFTFHRYGFPILPGSSVKGVARTWAFYQIANQINAPELEALEKVLIADGDEEPRYLTWRNKHPQSIQNLVTDFRAVFGTTAQAGKAIFFDAIPDAPPKLEVDVMSPHYPKYYGGEEYPTDRQNPIPIPFLTVAAGQTFWFAVGWRDADNPNLRQKAEEWLRKGLKNLGAGAKTSAGYGYFG